MCSCGKIEKAAAPGSPLFSTDVEGFGPLVLVGFNSPATLQTLRFRMSFGSGQTKSLYQSEANAFLALDAPIWIM